MNERRTTASHDRTPYPEALIHASVRKQGGKVLVEWDEAINTHSEGKNIVIGILRQLMHFCRDETSSDITPDTISNMIPPEVKEKMEGVINGPIDHLIHFIVLTVNVSWRSKNVISNK